MTETQNTPSFPYNDRFSTEVVSVSNGTDLKVQELWISSATLYHVSLALMAEYDRLVHDSNTNVRDKMLLNMMNSLKVGNQHSVSFHNLSNMVVNLHDSYKSNNFVVSTMVTNWKWTMNEEFVKEFGFDPYSLSKSESRVRLQEARLTLLIKAFRMYLIETVRRCFRRNTDPSEWNANNATYKSGGHETTSVAFITYVRSLMSMYDQVARLTPNLDEVKAIVLEAVETGKKEFSEKKEKYQQQKRLEANYKTSQRMEKEVKIIKEKEVSASGQQLDGSHSIPVENKWLNSNSNVGNAGKRENTKSIDGTINTNTNNNTNNNTSTVNNEDFEGLTTYTVVKKKRSIKSGGNKTQSTK